jgi:hypothetical protein
LASGRKSTRSISNGYGPWGKRTVLATSYVVETGEAHPRLDTIQAALIAAYPNIGPILA